MTNIITQRWIGTVCLSLVEQASEYEMLGSSYRLVAVDKKYPIVAAIAYCGYDLNEAHRIFNKAMRIAQADAA